MKKAIFFFSSCCMVLFFVIACGSGFAAEVTRKLPVKDPRILKQPIRRLPITTDQQQQDQPQPSIVNPEVVSIDILPPLADCRPRWQVTVRNPNSVPFDKEVTIHVVQLLSYSGSTVAKLPGDGLIAANSMPANQTTTVSGLLFGDLMETGMYMRNYRIDVKVDGVFQAIGDQSGQVPIFAQDITIGDCQMVNNNCRVTFTNQKPYQACFIYFGSEYGQGPAPATWTQGIGYRADIPPNGSVDWAFPRLSGYDTIKLKARLGGQIIAEKIMPLP